MNNKRTNVALLNPWGAGQLLAFSGLDGRTDYAEGLLIRTGSDIGVLRVEQPAKLTLINTGYQLVLFLTMSLVIGLR